MRKEFEAWIIDRAEIIRYKVPNGDLRMPDFSGETVKSKWIYNNSPLQNYWECWQAATKRMQVITP